MVIINQIVVTLIHIQLDIELIQLGLLFFQLVFLGEGTLRLFLCRFQPGLYISA